MDSKNKAPEVDAQTLDEWEPQQIIIENDGTSAKTRITLDGDDIGSSITGYSISQTGGELPQVELRFAGGFSVKLTCATLNRLTQQCVGTLVCPNG